jgi:hypothetical protein
MPGATLVEILTYMASVLALQPFRAQTNGVEAL